MSWDWMPWWTREGLRPRSIDVQILDAPSEGLRLIARMRWLNPDVPIVVWERSSASEPALNALGAGAHAVLLDSSALTDFHACIENVLQG